MPIERAAVEPPAERGGHRVVSRGSICIGGGPDVAHLNVRLDPERLDALRRYAARRRTPVAWLIKDYVDYLLSGGVPVVPPSIEPPTSAELAAIAQHGGSFDWLADEPDDYSADDGEPV